MINMELKKHCPKCGEEQIYSSWDSFRFSIRKNTICKECSRKNKIKHNFFKRICPTCQKEIIYNNYRNWWRATKLNRKCLECTSLFRKNTEFKNGHTLRLSQASKDKLKNSLIRHYSAPEVRQKMSEKIKKVWGNPLIREKYFNSMKRTKWIKVRSDEGQLELLKKWNSLGFNLEPNYQLHHKDFLCYLDGYDPKMNVVVEYDGKYHKKLKQKEKDDVRQKKIIDILHPKKFWRYNSIDHKWKNILEDY